MMSKLEYVNVWVKTLHLTEDEVDALLRELKSTKKPFLVRLREELSS